MQTKWLFTIFFVYHQQYEAGEMCGLEPDGVCRRNADCRCLVRLFGAQSSLLASAKCKRARCIASKSKVNMINGESVIFYALSRHYR